MNAVFTGKWIVCEGIYAMVLSLIREGLGYVPSMPTPLRVDSSSLEQWHSFLGQVMPDVIQARRFFWPSGTTHPTWRPRGLESSAPYRRDNFKSGIPPWSAAPHRRDWEEHGGTETPSGSAVRSGLSLGYLQGNKWCSFPACVPKHEGFPRIVYVVSYRFSIVHFHRIFLGDSSPLCLQYNKKCKYIHSIHKFILQIQPATCLFYWFDPL
jgi:hypothetical protein